MPQIASPLYKTSAIAWYTSGKLRRSWATPPNCIFHWNHQLPIKQTGSTSAEAAPESFLEYITEAKGNLDIVYKGILTAKLYHYRRPQLTIWRVWENEAHCSISLLAAIATSALLKRRRRWFVIKSLLLQFLRKLLEHPSMRRQRASPPESFQPQVSERLLRKVLQVMIQGQRSSHESLQDLYQTLVKIFASIPTIFSRAWWLRSDVRVTGENAEVVRLWEGKLGALGYLELRGTGYKEWTPSEYSAGGQLESGSTMGPLAIKPGCHLFTSWPPSS
ncbi:hypothetical protein R3P38DRAFT_3361810 [Favolaschia claudopus]|uniref:Peroxisomal membrane protein PEX16 n=1 Tax=Favolaschia claudopus TaxID=2862362 RepID=A0AAW0AQL5_9AGAR